MTSFGLILKGINMIVIEKTIGIEAKQLTERLEIMLTDLKKKYGQIPRAQQGVMGIY